jgi:hypothetical protein
MIVPQQSGPEREQRRMPIPAEQGPSAAMVVPKFFVKQRITLMVNRYEIHAANPDGTEGQLLANA